MPQETMGSFNVCDNRIYKAPDASLNAPRTSHWRRSRNPVNTAVLLLQQNSAISKLLIGWNIEMVQ
jgi:hypothetical protein